MGVVWHSRTLRFYFLIPTTILLSRRRIVARFITVLYASFSKYSQASSVIWSSRTTSRPFIAFLFPKPQNRIANMPKTASAVKNGLLKLWPFSKKRSAEEDEDEGPVERIRYTPRHAERDALLSMPSPPVKIPRPRHALRTVKSTPAGFQYSGSLYPGAAPAGYVYSNAPGGFDPRPMPLSDDPRAYRGIEQMYAGRAYSMASEGHPGSFRGGPMQMGEDVPVVPRIPSMYVDPHHPLTPSAAKKVTPRPARPRRMRLVQRDDDVDDVLARRMACMWVKGNRDPDTEMPGPPIDDDQMLTPARRRNIRYSRSIPAIPTHTSYEPEARDFAYQDLHGRAHAQVLPQAWQEYEGKGKGRIDSGSTVSSTAMREYGPPPSPPPNFPLPPRPVSPKRGSYRSSDEARRIGSALSANTDFAPSGARQRLGADRGSPKPTGHWRVSPTADGAAAEDHRLSRALSTATTIPHHGATDRPGSGRDSPRGRLPNDSRQRLGSWGASISKPWPAHERRTAHVWSPPPEPQSSDKVHERRRRAGVWSPSPEPRSAWSSSPESQSHGRRKARVWKPSPKTPVFNNGRRTSGSPVPPSGFVRSLVEVGERAQSRASNGFEETVESVTEGANLFSAPVSPLSSTPRPPGSFPKPELPAAPFPLSAFGAEPCNSKSTSQATSAQTSYPTSSESEKVSPSGSCVGTVTSEEIAEEGGSEKGSDAVTPKAVGDVEVVRSVRGSGTGSVKVLSPDNGMGGWI